MTPPTAQPATVGRPPALPGLPFPLGATVRDGGTNFAVEAAAADSMLACLFDESGAETQIPLLDYDAGVWHGFSAAPSPSRRGAQSSRAVNFLALTQKRWRLPAS